MTDGEAVHPLVGSWRLRSWVAVADDGSESEPMGSGAEGLLVYSADGTMVALMGRRARAAFGAADLTGGRPAEQAEAFRTFIAYGGGYAVEGSTVTHRVEMSLFPDWVGTVQQRRWQLDDGGRQLTLTSPPITLGGQTRVQRLTWQRVRR